jgi:hypothetical protein
MSLSLNLNPQVSRVKPLFDYLKKQQENRKFVKSIEIGATFILVTFFLVFALRPTIVTISALKGDIESKKILKEELRVKINKVIAAQELFSQVQERYAVVNSSLPDKPNYFDSATIVQQIAKKYNIPADSLAFTLDSDEVKEDQGIKSFSVGVGVNGPFTNALNFAADVLKNRRTDYISTISFATSADSASTASPSASSGISTRFSTVFYYWPPATSPQNAKK